MRKPARQNLLTNAITTGAGGPFEPWGTTFTYHGSGTTSTGSGSAVIDIEVSNDTSLAWITMGTITLTLGTTATADGFSAIVPWKYVRANVTTLTGTDATVTVVMGNLA